MAFSSPEKIALLILLVVLIIISLGCASEPKTTKVDLNWKFCEVVPQENWACLKEDDVKKLRQALIECRSKK